MVTRVASGKALPDEVLQQIVARTDGVPLFVEELTKMVLESGLLHERQGHYELTGPLPPLAIPTTLHDSLMARLDRLATVREVAQLGATLGREFTYELLQAIWPLDEETLQRGLRRLVDAELLQSLVTQGVVPVIPPLGFDGDGKTYRVNSDGVAVAVAEQLKAIKLIFVTSHDGLVHRSQLIRQMPVAELSKLVQQDAAGFLPEMLSKAQHAAAACNAGVPRVHVINGALDEGLLGEVFSNHGLGTLIYANEYENIRPARKKDVRAIQMLTKQGVEADELVKRTQAAIEKSLSDYFIFEIDKNPVACVALHIYPEENQGELASLYVSASHENQGIGRKLIQYVESRARELGLRQLLALSTQAFTYFQSKANFVEGTPDDLPPARRERYEQSGRNSKVLVRKLN